MLGPSNLGTSLTGQEEQSLRYLSENVSIRVARVRENLPKEFKAEVAYPAHLPVSTLVLNLLKAEAIEAGWLEVEVTNDLSNRIVTFVGLTEPKSKSKSKPKSRRRSST